MAEQDVALDTLGQGAAVERFGLALQKVLDNIQDPNTNPKAKRSVTLKVTISPAEDRSVSDVQIDVLEKLAPIKPFGTRLFMGRDKDGKGVASEHIPDTGLFDQPKEIPETDKKVYQMKKEVL